MPKNIFDLGKYVQALPSLDIKHYKQSPQALKDIIKSDMEQAERHISSITPFYTARGLNYIADKGIFLAYILYALFKLLNFGQMSAENDTMTQNILRQALLNAENILLNYRQYFQRLNIDWQEEIRGGAEIIEKIGEEIWGKARKINEQEWREILRKYGDFPEEICNRFARLLASKSETEIGMEVDGLIFYQILVTGVGIYKEGFSDFWSAIYEFYCEIGAIEGNINPVILPSANGKSIIERAKELYAEYREKQKDADEGELEELEEVITKFVAEYLSFCEHKWQQFSKEEKRQIIYFYQHQTAFVTTLPTKGVVLALLGMAASDALAVLCMSAKLTHISDKWYALFADCKNEVLSAIQGFKEYVVPSTLKNKNDKIIYLVPSKLVGVGMEEEQDNRVDITARFKYVPREGIEDLEFLRQQTTSHKPGEYGFWTQSVVFQISVSTLGLLLKARQYWERQDKEKAQRYSEMLKLFFTNQTLSPNAVEAQEIKIGVVWEMQDDHFKNRNLISLWSDLQKSKNILNKWLKGGVAQEVVRMLQDIKKEASEQKKQWEEYTKIYKEYLDYLTQKGAEQEAMLLTNIWGLLSDLLNDNIWQPIIEEGDINHTAFVAYAYLLWSLRMKSILMRGLAPTAINGTLRVMRKLGADVLFIPSGKHIADIWGGGMGGGSDKLKEALDEECGALKQAFGCYLSGTSDRAKMIAKTMQSIGNTLREMRNLLDETASKKNAMGAVVFRIMTGNYPELQNSIREWMRHTLPPEVLQEMEKSKKPAGIFRKYIAKLQDEKLINDYYNELCIIVEKDKALSEMMKIKIGKKIVGAVDKLREAYQNIMHIYNQQQIERQQVKVGETQIGGKVLAFTRLYDAGVRQLGGIPTSFSDGVLYIMKERSTGKIAQLLEDEGVRTAIARWLHNAIQDIEDTASHQWGAVVRRMWEYQTCDTFYMFDLHRVAFARRREKKRVMMEEET